MARRRAADVQEETEGVKSEDSSIIRPGDPIDLNGKTIYIVNITNKDKVFNDGEKSTRLTCPGTPGSVQVLTKNMLNSPGFAAMHNLGHFMLTYSSDMRASAISNAEYADRQDEKRLADLKASVSYKDENVTDVSDRLDEIKQED